MHEPYKSDDISCKTTFDVKGTAKYIKYNHTWKCMNVWTHYNKKIWKHNAVKA